MLALALEETRETQLSLEPARMRVSEKGRVVIPINFREALGIKVGDLVNLEIVGNELRISTFSSRLQRTRARLKHYVTPGKLASEEIIEESRREARKEELEFMGPSRKLDDDHQAKG